MTGQELKDKNDALRGEIRSAKSKLENLKRAVQKADDVIRHLSITNKRLREKMKELEDAKAKSGPEADSGS